MSSIVNFRPRLKAAGASSRSNDAPATIIIFPGVRYERLVSPEAIEKLSATAWMAKAQTSPALTT